jgi:pyruvate kinase
LQIDGPTFVPYELQKIEQAVQAGFKQYFLSYVESNRDIDQFLELVGRDSSIMLKIESKKGLEFVAREFRKRPNINLVAARGDLYVEIDRPHDIMSALKLIIKHDPEACVGSRLLLSVVNEPVPSCADFLEMAWLCDIGYRSFMLCDELCLVEERLATAINAFQAFRESYI